MYSENDIPKDSLFHYQKQFREGIEPQMIAEEQSEAKKEKAVEKIKARKNAEYANLQSKRNHKLSLWSLIVAIVALIVSMISMLKDIL